MSSSLREQVESQTPVGLSVLASEATSEARVAGKSPDEAGAEGASPAALDRGRDLGTGLDVESEVPRFRVPKWLGVAALAGAVVLVVLTILVAAPDRGVKAGARANASAAAVSAAPVALAETPFPSPAESSTATALAPLPAESAGSSELVELVVRASPAFAKVAVDGTPAGRNPFRASYPKGGEVHRITASADGYETKSESVRLTSDVVIELSLNRSTWQPASPPRRTAVAPQPAASSRPPVSQPQQQPTKPTTASQPQMSIAVTGGEVDSSGGRKPLRPIETKDPYGTP